jgi:hypothetical protein
MNVFISYRRADSLAVAGRLYDRLRGHFGAASVFRDLDGIAPGEDFRESLQRALGQTDAMLALIGPAWLGQGADGAAQ